MMEHLGIEYFRILPQYKLEPLIKKFLKYGIILDEVDILPLFHRLVMCEIMVLVTVVF